MSDDEKSKPRWAFPDDGLVHLQDLSFDFEDYFERYYAGDMSDDEKKEFSARVYGMFCRDFYDSGGDPGAVKPWVANYLADKLYQVLGGVPWQDIMNMPWEVPAPLFTRQGDRAMSIYCAVENALIGTPDANVTDLIAEQAKQHNVSYETARSDYYAIKKGIKWKTGIPANFLIDGGDS